MSGSGIDDSESGIRSELDFFCFRNTLQTFFKISFFCCYFLNNTAHIQNVSSFCYGDVLLRRRFVWRRFVEETFCAETFCIGAVHTVLYTNIVCKNSVAWILTSPSNRFRKYVRTLAINGNFCESEDFGWKFKAFAKLIFSLKRTFAKMKTLLLVSTQIKG
jgi:hypothetical protein